jgi:hypothetical protein
MARFKDMIDPMTLGNMRANGVRSLDGHSVTQAHMWLNLAAATGINNAAKSRDVVAAKKTTRKSRKRRSWLVSGSRNREIAYVATIRR